MAVVTKRYGRYVTAAEDAFGLVGSGEMRATVFDKLTAGDLWVYQIGIWGGRYTATSPTVRLALYTTTTGMEPTTRIAYTASQAVSGTMTATGGGAAITLAVAQADNAPTNTACKLASGSRYAVAVLSTGAQFGYSLKSAASITANNENVYKDYSLSQPPPASFNIDAASQDGHLSIWVTGELNEAPLAPSTGIAPATGSMVTTLTPAFQATFRDLNGAYGTSSGLGADRGDRLNRVHLQISRADTGELVAEKIYTASATEQTNNQSSWTYAGPALERGRTYKWRIRQSDQFDTWSAWSSYFTFDTPDYGQITGTGTPTGKNKAINGFVFQFSWTHSNASAMTSMKVRVLQGQTAIRTSGWIANSVGSGASGTLNWPNGFADLEWGETYAYQLKGVAADGVESEWSAQRTFTTDAAPSVPINNQPTGGMITNALPTLTCQVTDTDATTAPTDTVTVTARIYGPEPITNGTFDSNVTGWSRTATADITSTLAQDATVFNSGTGSAKVAITASTAASGSTVDVTTSNAGLPVIPGQGYTIRAYNRTDTLNLAPVLFIQWYTSGGTLISTSTEATYVPAAINTWAQRSLVAIAPATAATMKPGWQVVTRAANATGNVWLDDLSFDDGYRYARTMSYDSPSGLYIYTCTATDMPAYGTYKWDAYAYDGTLYSGETTTLADATASTFASFSYAAGPAVVLAIDSKVVNGNFNTNTTGWTAGANAASITATWARTTATTFASSAGAYAYTVTANTAAGTVTAASSENTDTAAKITAAAGETIKVIGAVRTSNANLVPLLAINWYNSSDVLLSTSAMSGWTPVVDTWYAKELAATAPANTSYGRAVVRVQSNGTGNLGTVVFDEVASGTAIARASTITVRWVATAQTKYQVLIRNAANTTVLASYPSTSPGVSSTVLSYDVPGEIIRNNTSYNVAVQITDAGTNVGSATQALTATFTSTIELQYFTAWTPSYKDDPVPATVRLKWDPATLASPPWLAYDIYRDDGTTEVRLARVTNINTTTFDDYAPPSGLPVTYSIYNVATQGSAEVKSTAMTETRQIDLIGAVIHNIANGDDERVNLHYATDRSFERQIIESVYTPLNGSDPITVRRTTNYKTWSGTFQLIKDDFGTPSQRLELLELLAKPNVTLCYRDERGRRLFCKIVALSVADKRPQRYDVQINFREEYVKEGV